MKKELGLFKALSDETRLRIMALLSKRNLCVCQLEWTLGLSQAKVSRHLTVLKNAGLVRDRREGLWVFYSLSEPGNELERFIHKYLRKYFSQRHEISKRDMDSLKECEAKPLEQLRTIRGKSRGGRRVFATEKRISQPETKIGHHRR